MRDFFRNYISIFLVLLSFSCQQKNVVDKVPIETFFKDPQQSKFNISPDGKYISFLKPYKGKLNIYVQSLNDHSITRITSFTDHSVKYHFWAGSNHLVYGRNKGAGDNLELYSS